MALAIDASTPAVAVSTSNTTTTVTTASFTPPANSLLLVRWSWNTSASDTPAAPSITDSLGSPLTYTLIDHKTRAAGGAVDGQAAAWWAKVTTSTAMTVTVTRGTGTNTQGGALHVTVITGHDTTNPIGAHGKSGSTSASSIAQSYTAQATGGQGFIVVTDWDLLGAETAGTGCTLTNGGSGSAGTEISYGFVRRTLADDANGGSNTLNVTIPGTSTNLSWVYAEVVPPAVAGGSTPIPVVVVPTPARPQPSQPQILRGSLQDPPILTTPQPIVVVGSPGQRGVANLAQTFRASLVDVVVPATPTPPPLVVTQQPPRPVTPQLYLGRAGLVEPPMLSTPQPIVLTPAPITQWPNRIIVQRGSLVDPATPQPLVVSQPVRSPAPMRPVILRASLADAVVTPTTATPSPLVVTSTVRRPSAVAIILRAPLGSTVCVCTTTRPFTGVTTRPASGATARPSSGITARPGTGTTTRPYAGVTTRPCTCT